MRASLHIALLMGAVVVCTMGVPQPEMVTETLPSKSLYEQQTTLFEEILDVSHSLLPRLPSCV